MRRTLVLPLALTAAAACSPAVKSLPPVELAAYQDSITTWQKVTRYNAIAGPTGWATLVGLWWLRPGESRIGTDSTFEIVLPKSRAGARVGSLIVEGDSTRFVAASGAKVAADSQPVSALRLHSDLEEKGSVLATGSLLIYYIERSGKKAVRIKDTLHVVRTTFPGLQYFRTDTAWRVTARFVPRAKPDSMNIIDVLGIETRMWWPGELRFTVKGREYVLQLIREPEEHSKRMFVMFRDSTNGKETYPAMRYTYVDQPDSTGRTILDFNRSYNPPCAFTGFATCPLPPKGNTLALRVNAGELKPAGHP